jgi:hypothetical protein
MVESRQKVSKEKSEVELLKEQLAALTKLVNKQAKEAPIKKADYVDEDDDGTNISSDTYIKVMSLTPYYLTLTTQEHGKGKKFNFEKYGDVKRILYHDLCDIMEQHPNFLEEFYYVILNRDVVRKHGLDDLYSRMLTKETIDKIIDNGNDTDSVNLFKACGETQREHITTILLNKMLNNEFVDLNLLDRFSRVVDPTGKYSIAERGEEMKQVAALKTK